MSTQSRASISLGSAETDLDPLPDGNRCTFRDLHAVHVQARMVRKHQSPVRKGWLGWLGAPIIQDRSTRGLILAEIEMERQRELNAAMWKMVAALASAVAVIGWLA